jgi:hypothetical protein
VGGGRQRWERTQTSNRNAFALATGSCCVNAPIRRVSFLKSIDLAGAESQFAMLWYPIERTDPPPGVPLGPVWKLLDLKDPYTQREQLLTAPRYRRTFDGQPTQIVPLGVYSLTYPKMPLMMIDFRDGTHLRRHEMTQRAINEVTSGMVGLSRFTNWYYYIGADLYYFYAPRRCHESARALVLLLQVPRGASAR